MKNVENCIICGLENAIEGFSYCSKECALMERLCTRIKRVEDMLVEIKHQLRDNAFYK